MNEFDFSQLNSVKTPEKWIDAALNIPQKKYTPPLLKLRPYIIGTAASVVIVAAVVLTLLFNSGGESPLAPKSVFPVQPTAAEEATEQSDGSADSRAQDDKVYATEIIEETNAAGEVVATYVVPVTDAGDSREASKGASQAVLPTSSAGETIAGYTVPVTRADGLRNNKNAASRSNPQNDPSTDSESQNGAEPSDVPKNDTEAATVYTKPDSAPSSAAADTTTNSWWNDPVNDHTEQAWSEETWDEDEYSGTNAVTSPAPYRGPLTLSVSPNSPLFNSKFIRLNLTDDRDGELIHYLVVKPVLGSSGNKEVTFGQELFLYPNRTYTLLAYDTKGNSVTATFSVGGSDSVIIYI